MSQRHRSEDIDAIAQEFDAKADDAVAQEDRKEGFAHDQFLLAIQSENDREDNQIQSCFERLDREETIGCTIGDSPTNLDSVTTTGAHASDAIEGQFDHDSWGKEVHHGIEARLHDKRHQEDKERREIEDAIQGVTARPGNRFSEGRRILKIIHDLRPEDLQDDHHATEKQGRIPFVSIDLVGSDIKDEAKDDADDPEEGTGRNGKRTNRDIRKHLRPSANDSGLNQNGHSSI